MDTDIKAKFLKTSELYFKITKRDTNTSNVQNVAELMFLEKKMAYRFLHNTKSLLLDKIS